MNKKFYHFLIAVAMAIFILPAVTIPADAAIITILPELYDNGSVTLEGTTNTFSAGDLVQISAIPATGYQLTYLAYQEMVDDGEEEPAAVPITQTQGGYYVFSAPDTENSLLILAEFEELESGWLFKMDGTDSSLLRAYVDGTRVYSNDVITEGKTVTLQPSDPYKYALKDISFSPAVTYSTTADGFIEFTMPSAHLTVTANSIEAKSYDITYSFDSTGGSVSGNSSAKYGESVTVTVTENDDYQLASLTATNTRTNTAVTVTDNTFTMSDGPVTVTAIFEEIPEYSIDVQAVDLATGSDLAGAVNQIRDSGGNVLYEWYTASRTVTLKPGTYTLRNYSAPAGYVVWAADATITVADDGTVTVTGTNAVYEDGILSMRFDKTEIKVSAVYIGDGSEQKGATLQIIDSDNNVVITWTSETEAYTHEGLTTGKTYTLRSTVAPDGYTLAPDTTFVLAADGTVDETNTTATVDGAGVLLVEFDKTSIKVSAVDTDTNEKLEGATLQILDGTTEVTTWTSTAEAYTYEGLTTGKTYTLRNTAAPTGYATALDATFTIDTNGKVTYSGSSTADGIMQVKLSAKTYYIRTDPAQGGYVSTTLDTAKYGQTVTVSVNANTGYYVASVSYYNETTGQYVSITDNQFTMPDSDVTVSASFSPQTYTISVGEVPTGITITPNRDSAKMGETVTLTVSGIPFGYQLTISGVGSTITAGENGDYTFTMPAADVTVSAVTGISLTEVDTAQKLYRDENTKKYYQLNAAGTFDEVHVHENNGSYTVFNKEWNPSSSSITESGNYVLAKDSVVTQNWRFGENITVNLCLNGYSIGGTTITAPSGTHLTVNDCGTTSGYVKLVHVQDGASVTWNGGNVGAVAVYTGSTLNLGGAPVIAGINERGTIYPGITYYGGTVNLLSGFAGTNGKTGDGADTCIAVETADAVAFGTPLQFVASGGTDANKDLFAYYGEVPAGGVVTDIETVHKNGTLAFKAVHRHTDGTVYDQPWDGNPDITENGSYVLTADHTDATVYITGNVSICLNGHELNRSMQCGADYAQTPVAVEIDDCSGGDGYLTQLIADNNAAVTVKGGTFDFISVDAASLHLAGAPVIAGPYGSGISFTSQATISIAADFAGTNGKTDDDTRITAAPETAPTVDDYDVLFATVAAGGNADAIAAMFAYYNAPNGNISVVADGTTLYFRLAIISVDGMDKEAIDNIPAGGNGIYEDENGKEIYIPTPDDNNEHYTEVLPDDNGDGIFEDEEDNRYLPVDKDGDGKADDSLTDQNKDGIFEDENGNTYVPDQNGDGKPEQVEDKDKDGFFEDEKGNKYLPDTEDGEADQVVKNPDGSYTDEDDRNYLPDQDGDGQPETDGDNNGIYEGTKDDTTYIPDQDGDGKAQPDTDGDGIFEDAKGNEAYVPVDKDDDGKADTYVDKDDVTNGVYADPDTDRTYKDDDGDGVLDLQPAYRPVLPIFYTVTVNESANGTAIASRKSAPAGATVTLTATPDADYKLQAVLVTDRFGNVIPVVAKANGTYTFTMPERSVSVTAIFEKTTPAAPPVHICPSKVFSDVNTDLWYHEAIDFVLLSGYMNKDGMGDGTFQPDTALSRAMLVQVLYNMEGQPEVKTSYGFSDVDADAWYADAINWAAANGIVNGYGDTFGPNDPITREQMVTILYRYADYKGLDMSTRLSLSVFHDGDEVSDWASAAVEWAVAVGLISAEGNGDGNFAPTGTATRAQVAQVLMNYCKNVLGE